MLYKSKKAFDRVTGNDTCKCVMYIEFESSRTNVIISLYKNKVRMHNQDSRTKFETKVGLKIFERVL